MRRPKYTLSPNEIERLVREDQERRRKLRIIQVREQSKDSAAIIRRDVRREKERLLNNFAAEVKEKLEAEKEENIRQLEHKYERTLQAIGEGHKEALIHGDGENRAEKLQKQMEEEAAAQERYKQALERQKKEDADRQLEKTKHILARQAALLTEKLRAADIAGLPPPPPDISVQLEKTQKRAVPMVDMQAFATTHYHIPDYHVVRAGSQEQLYDAKSQAQDSDLRLKQDLEDKARSERERLERARIRGNEALHKEMLKHEYNDLLKDLSILQKQDRRRRKKMLSQIPNQVFMPPELYLGEQRERQHEMERKFTAICMDQLRMDRDKQRETEIPDQKISYESQDVPTPQTANAATAAVEDFSISMSCINPALRDLTNLSQPATAPEIKKPDTVLKQLLNRIKEQRDDSDTKHNKVPTAAYGNKTTMPKEDQQLVLEAGSKAVWTKVQDNSPGPQACVAGHQGRSQGHSKTAPKPGINANAMSENEKMIEDLRRRIELIESQKEELARQLKAPVRVNGLVMEDVEDLTSVDDDDQEGWTLEEVDIDAFTAENVEDIVTGVTAVNIPPAAGAGQVVTPLSAWTPAMGGAGQVVTPLSTWTPAMGGAGQVVTPLSAWKPAMGGAWNTAGGPCLRTDVGPGCIFGAKNDNEQQHCGSVLPVDSSRSNIGPLQTQSVRVPPVTSSWDTNAGFRTNVGFDFTLGARRNVEVQQDGTKLQRCGMAGVLSDGGDTGSASGILPRISDTKVAWQYPPSFDKVTLSSLGYGTMGSLPDESTGHSQARFARQGQDMNGSYGQRDSVVNDNADLMRKVRDYRERAVERQASLDAETLSKVREYQRQLLQTYTDRKKYLADVRADIEKRQRELCTVASSQPVFSVESIQLQQSVADRLGHAPGHSHTVSADQKKIVSSTDVPSVTNSSTKSKSLEMNATTSGSLLTSLLAPTAILEHVSAGQECFPGTVPHRVPSQHQITGQEQKIITNLEYPKATSSDGNRNTDRVRKSLSFDDADESLNAGHDIWGDVVIDSDNRECSYVLTENSRLMTSEEERGSPLLPSGQIEMSKNITQNGGAYFSELTLLAQAQERKLAFVHKQRELQNQLMDIQQQKDAIMQAYHGSQCSLQQQRQALLVSQKAAPSAVFHQDKSRDKGEEVRAKLANIRCQIDADAKDRTAPEVIKAENMAVDLIHDIEARSYSRFSNDNVSVPLHVTEHLSESRDMDRTGSRQSAGSVGMLANSSSDSYLADISFHKITSDDGRSLHSSAFHVPIASSSSVCPQSTSVAFTQQQHPQTWASILSTSIDGRQQQKAHSDDVTSQNVAVTSSCFSADCCQQQWRRVSGDSDVCPDEDVDGSNSALGVHQLSQYTSSPMSTAMEPHRAHELSTILEVDTPSSLSAITSIRKLASVSDHATDVSSSNSSSSALARSLPNTTIHSGISMDAFKKNVQALSLSDAIPNFKFDPGYVDRSMDMSGPNLSTKSTILSDQKRTTAKRSLDFSENSQLAEMPALELTQHRVSDLHDLSRQGLQQVTLDINQTLSEVDDDDDSSVKISGFSEYLRLQGQMDGKAGEECVDYSALSVNVSKIDSQEQHTGSLAASDNTSDRPEELSSVPCGHSLGADGVKQLRQRSKAVFSHAIVGDSCSEVSVVSLSCSPLSCDVEEVSLQGADNQGTAEPGQRLGQRASGSSFGK